MAPKDKGGGGEPTGELAKAIDAAFDSFDKFKDKMKRGRARTASAAAGPGSSSRTASWTSSAPPTRTAPS